MPEPSQDLGRQFRAMRQQCRLSAADVAHALNYKVRSSVLNWEHGRTRIPAHAWRRLESYALRAHRTPYAWARERTQIKMAARQARAAQRTPRKGQKNG